MLQAAAEVGEEEEEEVGEEAVEEEGYGVAVMLEALIIPIVHSLFWPVLDRHIVLWALLGSLQARQDGRPRC